MQIQRADAFVLRMPKSPLLVETSLCSEQNKIRDQPEIKMADVKQEVLIPEIADGVYVKFQ